MFKACLLATVILGVTIVGPKQGWFIRPSFFFEIIIFLTVSTISIYWWTTQRAYLRSDNFVNIYLGSTALRIVLYGIFVATIVSFDEAGAVNNALLFLIAYFLFTALEVTVLFLQINSPNSIKNDD